MPHEAPAKVSFAKPALNSGYNYGGAWMFQLFMSAIRARRPSRASDSVWSS